MSEREKPELSLPLQQHLTAELPEHLEESVWAHVRARRQQRSGKADEPRMALPLPLGDLLADGDKLAHERARLWRSVRARVRKPRARRLPRRYALAFAAAVGAAAAAVAFLVLTWRPSDPLAGRERQSALMAADGRPLGLLEAEAEPRTVRLSDRSEIRLDRGARVEPVLSTSSRFELLLSRGTAEFSVTPGGTRRWSIDAGAARVEVVGTVFRVARRPGGVDVSVSRGIVLVLGEGVPGRVKKLVAGQVISVESGRQTESEAAKGESASGALAETAAETPAASTQDVEPESPPAARGASEEGRQSSASALVRRRTSAAHIDARAPSSSPHERYAQLGPAGIARETMKATTIEQLLELADVARLSGHPQDAVAPLTRALDAFRGSRQAALAAFTLGRVLLDQLGVPEPAAEAFERAIVLGLPRALRADCYRRLAEAYGRAGKEAERARAEGRFQAEFALPSGTLDAVAP